MRKTSEKSAPTQSTSAPENSEAGFGGFVKGLFSGSQFKPTVAILYVCFAGTLWKGLVLEEAQFVAFSRFLQKFLPFIEIAPFFVGTYRIFAAFFLFALIPGIILRWGFCEKLSDYGVGVGNFYRTCRSFLILCPIMVLIGMLSGRNEAFLEVYPLNPSIRPGSSVALFSIHSLSYIFYYAGWEFLFRGFLQKTLLEQMGPFSAVLVQTLASTMMHFGNPISEVFGAILGGLFWGFLVFRTRSLLSGFMQHTVLGISLDAALVMNPQIS